MYNVCSKKLGIENPNFTTINRLIAQIMSNLVKGTRFTNECLMDTSLSGKISGLSVKQGYDCLNIAIPKLGMLFDKSETEKAKNIKPEDVLDTLFFDNDSSMLSVDCSFRGKPKKKRIHKYEKLMNPKIRRRKMMRRDEAIYKTVREELGRNYFAYDLMLEGKMDLFAQMKFASLVQNEEIVFTENSTVPISSKFSILETKPFVPDTYDYLPTKYSGTLLANHSAIGDFWFMVEKKFKPMYAKRSFVHWFVGEGMESGAFNEAEGNLRRMCDLYRSKSLPSSPQEEEE